MTSTALITLKMGAGGFRNHWKHCDQVANYLASFARARLERSREYENLLSTVLNELLELVFRRNASTGEITLAMFERGDTGGAASKLHIEVLVPVGEIDRAFYVGMAALLVRSDLDRLRDELAEAPPEIANLTAGLLELASTWGAELTVGSATDGRVRLLIAFSSDGGESA